MLLKTFEKVIVVGVTPGGMTTLEEISSDEYRPEDIESSTQSFSDVFKTALGSAIPDGKVKDTFDRFVNRKKGGGSDEK
jgi:flagellar biogenesis protein FliO